MHTNSDTLLQSYKADGLVVDSIGLSVEKSVVDSLSSVGYEDFPLADMAQFGEQQYGAQEIYRDTTAEALFGSDATLAEGVQMVTTTGQSDVDASMSDAEVARWDSLDWVLNGGILLVIVAYLFCLHRYYYDVIALIHSSWQRNAPTNRDNERRRSDIFYGFLGKLFLLGVGFVGVFSSIWVIRHGGIADDIQNSYMALTPLVGIGLFVVVVLVQYLVLLLAGFVTRSISFISSLMRMRLVYFVFATIAVAPLLLVAQLANEYAIWQIITYIVASVVVFLYLRESVELFVSKKISILHWILYLCTVEILPLTLLWQMTVRLR